jgi:nucleoside-diphosphate-sugar epimerase
MKVAVTGAAGLTGGEVAARLLRQGHAVRAIVRRSDALVPAGSERVVADCERPEELAETIRGCDALVHAAGITLGRGVAEALKRAPMPRVVALSSAGVYSVHRAASRGYLEGEREIAATASQVCLVRPTMIYGSERDRNVHHVIGFARRWGFLPLVGPGRRLVQPIHYQDLAAVVVALTEGDATGVVDAGAITAITIRDALRAIFDALRRPVRLVPVPISLARGGARLLETIRGGRVVERVDRLLEDRVVDNTRVTELTRIEPRGFPAGVADQVAAIR